MMLNTRETEESLQETETRLRRELEELLTRERIRDLEHQIAAARMRAQQAHRNQETSPTQIDSVARPERDLTHDNHVQLPDSPPEQTPTTANPPSESYGIPRLEIQPPQDTSEAAGTDSSHHPILGTSSTGNGIGMDALTLQYYQDLGIPDDDDAELLFYDMDIRELYEYVALLEGNTDDDILQARQLSSAHYFIFMRTNLLDDIQKAINNAEKELTSEYVDDLDYALRLRRLVVMLIKKYERTQSLNDLEGALLHAEVMITVTHPHHPDRGPRLLDMIKMKYMRGLHRGSQDDIDEALSATLEALTAEDARDYQDHLRRLERIGDLNDLQAAINCHELLTPLLP